MPYIFKCECGQRMTVTDNHIGRIGQCVQCGREIKITRDRIVPIPTAPTSYTLSQQVQEQATANESGLGRKKLLLAAGAVLVLVITFPLFFGDRSERQAGQAKRPTSRSLAIPEESQKASAMAKRATASRIRCDRFDVIASLDGDTISLRLETDLPDYTNIMVGASRCYLKEDGTRYPLDYMSEASTVGKWRTMQTVSVADHVFEQLLQERIDLMTKIGEPFKVARVEDNIDVSFVVPINQDNPAFGERNANLYGTKVSKTGLRTVREEKKLSKPLGHGLSTYVPTKAHYASLKIGQRYRLSGKTNLMPEFEPVDPIDAMTRVRSLAPRSSIVVKQIRMKRTTPWYYVESSDARDRPIGSGWINSGGLLGQEIEIVQ